MYDEHDPNNSWGYTIFIMLFVLGLIIFFIIKVLDELSDYI